MLLPLGARMMTAQTTAPSCAVTKKLMAQRSRRPLRVIDIDPIHALPLHGIVVPVAEQQFVLDPGPYDLAALGFALVRMPLHDPPCGAILASAGGTGIALPVRRAAGNIVQHFVEGIGRNIGPRANRRPRHNDLHGVTIRIFLSGVADGNADQLEPCSACVTKKRASCG